MKKKKCIKCNKELLLDRFSRNKNKKDGLNHYCKDCQKVYKDNHYKNNKKYYIEKAIKYKQKDRKWLDDYKKNLKCSRCEFNHFAALDFHHIDSSTKLFSIANSILRGYSKKKILEEIKKCIVLCANCHRIHHYNERNSA